ncbi:MAG: aspartate-semialdehyde dehydrogenase, partial [Bdellovibrionales bacterium]|nr:aspartate-semialdehyde dehydrogenase [Bdellovibrionales bacterium]
HSHAESVNVEMKRELTPKQFCELLDTAEGITPYPQSDLFPMQLDAAGKDPIHVGRIRKDESVAHGLNMWIVADNIRKGAALNAVQIMELLLNQ